MPNKNQPKTSTKNATVRFFTRVFGSLIVLAVMLPTLSAASDDCKCRAELPQYPDQIFPPWQKGDNNDALNRGVDFTIPQIDSLADFHGDLTDPKLVLYVGGTDDPLHLMTGISSKLNDDQIAAVAAYYASLPVVPGAAAKPLGSTP